MHVNWNTDLIKPLKFRKNINPTNKLAQERDTESYSLSNESSCT